MTVFYGGFEGFKGLNYLILLVLFVVGARGFEPPTPWSQTRCAARLRYAPTITELQTLAQMLLKIKHY